MAMPITGAQASPFTLEKIDARTRGETDLGWGVATIVEVCDVWSGPVVIGQRAVVKVRCKSCDASGLMVSERGAVAGRFQHVDGCRVLREVSGITGEVVR